MKTGFPGPATFNIVVIHAPFFRFHSITVNPSFECSEQNHHSDFVPLLIVLPLWILKQLILA
jgi:hypothetical protein